MYERAVTLKSSRLGMRSGPDLSPFYTYLCSSATRTFNGTLDLGLSLASEVNRLLDLPDFTLQL